MPVRTYRESTETTSQSHYYLTAEQPRIVSRIKETHALKHLSIRVHTVTYTWPKMHLIDSKVRNKLIHGHRVFELCT